MEASLGTGLQNLMTQIGGVGASYTTKDTSIKIGSGVNTPSSALTSFSGYNQNPNNTNNTSVNSISKFANNSVSTKTTNAKSVASSVVSFITSTNPLINVNVKAISKIASLLKKKK